MCCRRDTCLSAHAALHRPERVSLQVGNIWATDWECMLLIALWYVLSEVSLPSTKSEVNSVTWQGSSATAADLQPHLQAHPKALPCSQSLRLCFGRRRIFIYGQLLTSRQPNTHKHFCLYRTVLYFLSVVTTIFYFCIFYFFCKPDGAMRRWKAGLNLLDRPKSNYQSPSRLFSTEESTKGVFWQCATGRHGPALCYCVNK